MNKKKLFSGIGLLCLSLCLCACGQPEAQKAAVPEKTKVLDQYHEFFKNENAQKAALLYFDEDSVPELLLLKDGEYHLYFYNEGQINELDMPDAEIRANAYGPKYDFGESDEQIFYWFEYVPYKGLMRVHGGADQGRYDYYLQYESGFLSLELAAGNADYKWCTYDAEGEITNQEFLNRLEDLGYDELILCSDLYENVEEAYENIDAAADSKTVLNDFVSGKTEALDHVEKTDDKGACSFVMRSYEDYFNEITAEEAEWGREEYLDFDNDGEEELVLHGYAGSCLFFDTAGRMVYRVLRTSGTADVANVAGMGEKNVIERTDLLHAGRKNYLIMTFDPCCCLIDWFRLYTEYEGKEYSEEDVFEYRGQEITMEEFEKIVDSIQEPKT